jgi:uncharacterized caspase-like protein
MYVGAEHKLLIADACHSGLLLRGNGPKAPRLSADYLRDARRETFQVITAGTEKEEVLDGGPGGHSVFTGYLIERLEDNPDGVLTALELFAEVRDVVARRARDRGKQQTPNYNRISGSGDFLFYKQPPATGAEAEPASPDAATERGPAAARPATP